MKKTKLTVCLIILLLSTMTVKGINIERNKINNINLDNDEFTTIIKPENLIGTISIENDIIRDSIPNSTKDIVLEFNLDGYETKRFYLVDGNYNMYRSIKADTGVFFLRIEDYNSIWWKEFCLFFNGAIIWDKIEPTNTFDPGWQFASFFGGGVGSIIYYFEYLG